MAAQSPGCRSGGSRGRGLRSVPSPPPSVVVSVNKEVVRGCRCGLHPEALIQGTQAQHSSRGCPPAAQAVRGHSNHPGPPKPLSLCLPASSQLPSLAGLVTHLGALSCFSCCTLGQSSSRPLLLCFCCARAPLAPLWSPVGHHGQGHCFQSLLARGIVTTTPSRLFPFLFPAPAKGSDQLCLCPLHVPDSMQGSLEIKLCGEATPQCFRGRALSSGWESAAHHMYAVPGDTSPADPPVFLVDLDLVLDLNLNLDWQPAQGTRGPGGLFAALL